MLFLAIFTLKERQKMNNLSLINLLKDALLKAQSKTGEQTEQAPSTGIDKIMELFRSFSNKNTQENSNSTSENQAKNNPVEDKKATPQAPLQRQMLGTMKSHDEFIKRVMKRG